MTKSTKLVIHLAEAETSNTMAASTPHSGARPLALRLLLAGGVVGPLLFIAEFLIEGATRPGYSVWRHYVSALSLGEQGWMQITNFIICGTLVLGFAVGLRRVLRPGKGATWGPILLGLIGLGLIGSGVFVMDPTFGYPPGAPNTTTPHGTLHLLLGAAVFSALPAACFVLARRFATDPKWRRWAIYSLVTGVLLIVLLVMQKLAERSLDPNAPTGLIQRLTIITGWGWIAIVALRIMSNEPPPR
jgi:uncharacterized protein DUF998